MDRKATRQAFSVVLGERGRIVLPAEVRQRLDVQPGDRLILIVENKEARLVSAREQISRIAGCLRDLGPGVSMVDELIAERRAEAAREEADAASAAAARKSRMT